MDDYRYSPQDGWEYGTGRTDPPKSHTGILAVLLILVIFLTGIATVLGVLNIRLFRELASHQAEPELPISFTQTEAEADETQPETTLSGVLSESDFRLDLQRSPQEGGLSLQEIYAASIPSVVSISTDCGSGTGVVLSQNGYLVTNAHVVDGAKTIRVRLTDDREFTARILGVDDVSDLAVLDIDATDLTPARFGDSDSLRVGDSVVAIGDPLGSELRGTMTNGIISAINRDVAVDGRTMSLIQTNAALNSGNSGGPLINEYGQVVGINVIKMTSRYSNVEGLGFAIPTASMQRIVNDLLAYGEIQPEPLLGVTVMSLAEEAAEGVRGLRVDSVTPGGAGDLAGIRKGDFLLTADGDTLTTSQDLLRVRRRFYVGDSLGMTLWRDGQVLEVTLDLKDAVEEEPETAPWYAN